MIFGAVVTMSAESAADITIGGRFRACSRCTASPPQNAATAALN
jgi:hypothetical protein